MFLFEDFEVVLSVKTFVFVDNYEPILVYIYITVDGTCFHLNRMFSIKCVSFMGLLPSVYNQFSFTGHFKFLFKPMHSSKWSLRFV